MIQRGASAAPLPDDAHGASSWSSGGARGAWSRVKVSMITKDAPQQGQGRSVHSAPLAYRWLDFLEPYPSRGCWVKQLGGTCNARRKAN